MPGTKKILIFDAAAVTDWSQLPRGTRIKISSWTSASGEVLPSILSETSISEVWSRDSSGQACELTLSGTVREGGGVVAAVFVSYRGRPLVAVAEAVDGARRAFGSAGFPLRMSIERRGEGHNRELAWTLSCRTPQGALPCTM